MSGDVKIKLPEDTVKETAQLARDFGHTLGPAWQDLVGIVGDQLAYIRANRRLSLLKAFEGKCRARSLERPTRDIAPAFLVPLLDAATLEADDDLQGVWATMLANAADAGSDTEMRTAYVSMLSQMTHFDVRILSILVGASKAHPEAPNFITDHLPDAIGLGRQSHIKPLREDVEITLANLSRLGCLHPITTYGGLSYRAVSLTALGRAFARACSDNPI